MFEQVYSLYEIQYISKEFNQEESLSFIAKLLLIYIVIDVYKFNQNGKHDCLMQYLIRQNFAGYCCEF